MNYSGKVTADHPVGFDNSNPPSCIETITVFNVQWTDCPVEVEDEVREIWKHNMLGNDTSIYKWDENDITRWPIVAEYLKEKGVDKCWIHWWW